MVPWAWTGAWPFPPARVFSPDCHGTLCRLSGDQPHQTKHPPGGHQIGHLGRAACWGGQWAALGHPAPSLPPASGLVPGGGGGEAADGVGGSGPPGLRGRASGSGLPLQLGRTPGRGQRWAAPLGGLQGPWRTEGQSWPCPGLCRDRTGAEGERGSWGPGEPRAQAGLYQWGGSLPPAPHLQCTGMRG